MSQGAFHTFRKASSEKWINTIQWLGSIALNVVGSSNFSEFYVRSIDVGLDASGLLELDTWSDFAKRTSDEFTTYEWQRTKIYWQLFVDESVEGNASMAYQLLRDPVQWIQDSNTVGDHVFGSPSEILECEVNMWSKLWCAGPGEVESQPHCRHKTCPPATH